MYLAAVLEYLTAEIIELAGKAAQDHKKMRITPRHIMLAVKNDPELNDLLSDAIFSDSGVLPNNIHPALIMKGKKKQRNDSVASVASDASDASVGDATESENF